ncbi:MAG: hypothetical protein JHC13_05215 [Acidilobus sp.]|jgi:hypothetical protein|nr:hypothetical protein [Acidilobus sp.]
MSVFSVPWALVRDKVFGGIPLSGYRRPRLMIRAGRGNRLHVYEYDFSLPTQGAYEETYDISSGKNVIDLSGFGNLILSLKLDEADLRARIMVDPLQ